VDNLNQKIKGINVDILIKITFKTEKQQIGIGIIL